jgi:hypothetical protein
MKPTLLLAAGCSWVAGRSIDTDPSVLDVDLDHVEDSKFVREHSFAGILQKKLGLDELQFVAKNGSNNDTQFGDIVSYINLNRDRYSKIFVLWGLTSIYRWEMYSNSMNRVRPCVLGRDSKNVEVKNYFKNHWNEDYELSKLNVKIISLSGYLNSLSIDHLFFNAFQSYKFDIASKNFYRVSEPNNDLLSFLCQTNDIEISDKKIPWLNLYTVKEKQYNPGCIKKLQEKGILDRATAHPTVQAHKLIAEELHNYIKEN